MGTVSDFCCIEGLIICFVIGYLSDADFGCEWFDERKSMRVIMFSLEK